MPESLGKAPILLSKLETQYYEATYNFVHILVVIVTFPLVFLHLGGG